MCQTPGESSLLLGTSQILLGDLHRAALASAAAKLSSLHPLIKLSSLQTEQDSRGSPLSSASGPEQHSEERRGS